MDSALENEVWAKANETYDVLYLQWKSEKFMKDFKKRFYKLKKTDSYKAWDKANKAKG